MTTFEIGRLCIKTAGREAGKLCVVIKGVDDTYVMVTGPKSLTRVKRRKCNVVHLEPLDAKISIKSDAPDSEVEAELKKTDILKKYELPFAHVKEIHRNVEHRVHKHKKEQKEKEHEEKKEHKEVKSPAKKEEKKEHKEKKPAKKTEKSSKTKTPAEKSPAKKAAKKVTKKPAKPKAAKK